MKRLNIFLLLYLSITLALSPLYAHVVHEHPQHEQEDYYLKCHTSVHAPSAYLALSFAPKFGNDCCCDFNLLNVSQPETLKLENNFGKIEFDNCDQSLATINSASEVSLYQANVVLHISPVLKHNTEPIYLRTQRIRI